MNRLPATQDERRQQRILMVYPTIPPGTYWSYDKIFSLIGRKALMPPLGLLTVASLIPEAEAEIRLIDMNVEPLTERDLAWADAVFLSAMIVQAGPLEQALESVQAAGKPVVLGGPYPSSAYGDLEGVDHFIIGEAEDLFEVFWADWRAGHARRAYARVRDEAHRRELEHHFGADGLAVVSTPRPPLHESPLPRFDLLRSPRAYKSMAVQASRGCPIGCEFCDIWRRFGRRMRYKAVDRVLAEFDRLYELGWRHSIFIVDDNFIGHKGRARELLSAIGQWQREHGHPFDFCTEVTLTLADDPELLELMVAAGFDMVFVGIETPVAESLAETGKHINTRGDLVKRVRAIQGTGIQVSSGFIIGFDNDPNDVADRMIACIDELGIPVAMVGLLQAMPETDLHDRLERENRLRKRASGNNTHQFALNFEPARPQRQVVADYRRVIRHVYATDLESYYKRCRTLLHHWARQPYPTQGLRWFDVRACFSFLFILWFRPYRWHALRFVLETLFTKPGFFPVAISLGIQGHHFASITAQSEEAEAVVTFLEEGTALYRRLAELCCDLHNRHVAPVQARLEEHYEAICHVARDRYGALSELAEHCHGEVRDRHLVPLQAFLEEHYVSIRQEARERYDALSQDAKRTFLEPYQRFLKELDQEHQYWLNVLSDNQTQLGT